MVFSFPAQGYARAVLSFGPNPFHSRSARAQVRNETAPRLMRPWAGRATRSRRGSPSCTSTCCCFRCSRAPRRSFWGVAGLLQRRRGRTFAALGMAIGVPGLALCCALLVALPTALDTSIADPGAPVGGPKPPKEVPRPPESSLSFRSRSVSAAPTFWRKIVRATMFCRREEGLPLPPKHEALEARAGSTLVFEFRGEEALEGERGGPGPGHAPPSTRAPRGSTRRWRRDQTQEAPGSSNPSRSQGEPGGGPIPRRGDAVPRGVRRPPGRQTRGDSPRPYSVCPSTSFPGGL
jgi:hypothetical protein